MLAAGGYIRCVRNHFVGFIDELIRFCIKGPLFPLFLRIMFIYDLGGDRK